MYLSNENNQPYFPIALLLGCIRKKNTDWYCVVDDSFNTFMSILYVRTIMLYLLS